MIKLKANLETVCLILVSRAETSCGFNVGFNLRHPTIVALAFRVMGDPQVQGPATVP
jgi:hypothetical protein